MLDTFSMFYPHIGKRLGKNLVSETDAMITQYSDALEALMQKFRDQAVRDIVTFVQCAGKDSGMFLPLRPLISLQVKHWTSVA